jgi:hypothetical protein
MKKYLMTGVAALALCAAFTSCSKNEELFDQGAINQNTANQVVERYNQAFLKYIGAQSAADIPANQAWGFEGYSAGTRGVFSNGNEWAANDRDDLKYKVPPALTQPQIDAVVEYFQTVKNPGYKDPEWTQYFIQQVYKGGSSPRQDYSPEVYTAANGTSTFTGSSKMNYLAAYQNGVMDHNENFNGGDCGEKDNVLNYKGTLTEVEETYSVNDNDPNHRHKDKINLMTESSTQEFGYYVSNGSVLRKEYTGLVSFEKIIEVLGEEKAGCLRDGWNRSFMGFDYEMMTKEEAYQKNDDGTIKYLTYGDLPDAQYIWDGTSTYGSSRPAGTEFVLDAKGNKIPMLNSKTDGYCGVNGDIEQNSLIASHACEHKDRNPNQSDYYQSENCLNIGVITGKVSDGFLPVYTGSAAGTKWVKFTGAADGYYSDWIVTLTKAEKYDTTTPPSDPDDVCIIAEDLNAESATDFDFNDVVFTVHYTSNTAAEIEVIAAGATQLIKIGKSESSAQEVHQLFADANNNPSLATPDPTTGLYKMINTGAKADVNGLTHPKFNLVVDKSKRGDDVEIWVNKFEKVSEGVYKNVNNWIKLTATKGQPAAKLCVGVDFKTKYCDERESIKEKYPMFYNWIKDHPTLIWWY